MLSIDIQVTSSSCESANSRQMSKLPVQENCQTIETKNSAPPCWDLLRKDLSENSVDAANMHFVKLTFRDQIYHNISHGMADISKVPPVARSFSHYGILVNYPFGSSLGNLSNRFKSKTLCIDSAALRKTAAGDRRTEQRYTASQLSSQSSECVCTEQSKLSEESMSQVETACEKYQQQKKQFEIGCTQSGFHLEKCSAATCNIMKPAEEINCNFDRFVKDGNQPFLDVQQCLEQRDYSVNSTKPMEVSSKFCLLSPNTDNLFVNEDATSRRELLCSVSSDPEVYAKTPSIGKLNQQIEKLRGDMLALRSTTMSYKKYMERIFDELKVITIMHENNPKSEHEDATQMDYVVQKTKLSEENCHKSEFPKDYSEIKQVNTNLDPCLGAETTSLSGFSKMNHHATPLPSYQDALASGNVALKLSPLSSEEPSPTRRSKPFERPNSDPFVSCSTGSEDMFAEGQHPNTSAPSKYSVKSADSSLENESKRAREKIDQIRMIPVLCNPNTALHISECSIDSGYQGSFETSPRDRQGRDLASQADAASSPINEPPLDPAVNHNSFHHPGKTTHLPKRNNSVDPSLDDSSKLKDTRENINSFKKEQNKPNCTDSLNDPTKPNHDPNSSEEPKLSHSGQAMKLNSIDEVKDDINLESNAPVSQKKTSDIHYSNCTASVVTRPVPKQRTVFAAMASLNETSSTSTSNQKLNISPLISPPIEKPLHSDVTTSNANSSSGPDDSNATCISASSPVKPKYTRPQPPQCLTFLKPNMPGPVDTVSPLQSRVKLGVSAITPNSEKREGSVFHCTSQMSHCSNDANARMRKTTNTKQLLREKYAAVIERSAKASKSKSEDSSGESEWSMVRRRSMRMMTEFQICDFKDGGGAKKLNSCQKTQSKDQVLASEKHDRHKFDSPTRSRVDSANTPCSSYSVSPSAAVVSKQIFDEKSLGTKTKSHNAIHKSKPHVTNNQPNYSREPLPPPPPSPPRTPSDVEDTSSVPYSINISENNLLSRPDQKGKNETVSTKHQVFLAPLIRPKASVVESQKIDKLTSAQKTNFNGLKMSPNSKSAFKPVCTPSYSDDQNPPPPRSTSSDPDVVEPKRRLSLPQTTVSNKQRFLNEFMPNMAAEHASDLHSKTENASNFQRHSSSRKPRCKIESLDSIVSSEIEKVMSHEITGSKETFDDDTACFATTEPLFCELPKEDDKSHQESKPRRHVSCSKVRTSSVTSPCRQASLENQPIRFDKSDKISNVVGALRTAGYLRSSDLGQSYSRASHLNSSSLGKNITSLKESDNPAPAYTGGRPHYQSESKGHIQTCYKARSSTSLHQYETVKLVDDNRIHSQQKNRKHTSRDVPPDENKTHRSHKSTIALIRASLLGKRDKAPRSSTAEGKRNHAVNGQKIRSASVGDKLKVNEEFVFETKPSKSKSKDSKSKKSKAESKTTPKEKSKKNTKETKEKNKHPETPTDETFVFPDSTCVGYGNPDAEVMERFLAAAAAAASNTPRSPLQRLRSSFRTPKNKNRLLSHESRIRDDMDVTSKSFSSNFNLKNKSNIHNGQEFTYV